MGRVSQTKPTRPAARHCESSVQGTPQPRVIGSQPSAAEPAGFWPSAHAPPPEVSWPVAGSQKLPMEMPGPDS